jgi:hypothetical protein
MLNIILIEFGSFIASMPHIGYAPLHAHIHSLYIQTL